MPANLTEFKNETLHKHLQQPQFFAIHSIETDQQIFNLLEAYGHFSDLSKQPFDIENQEFPDDPILREIIETLTADSNKSAVSGYYKRHCKGKQMNSQATTFWKRICR